MIELSKRSEDRVQKPVVKLMFDRANLMQFLRNRQRVGPEQWKNFGLPTQDQIRNIHLEVIVRFFCTHYSFASDIRTQNYHRPIVGTFHAKYMVIDRRIACVSSNNIQDRVDLELRPLCTTSAFGLTRRGNGGSIFSAQLRSAMS